MSEKVIEVKGLSKQYRIGTNKKRAETLAGQIMTMVKAPIENFKRLSRLTRFSEDDDSVFWALNNVDFSVERGEILAIIGRNGAGKSTLLKILSRITEPTNGEAMIKGRVSSLLEVGTGFHPELTGIENIYMNGTILGMTKKEIDSKLEEIIEFSGIEKFLNTPVKFYSSGMKVRLGFSVAAHLDPEILIIDEVLAVGDTAFQQKCISKMNNFANSGRTILFVSHNMQAVRALCTSGILLKDGEVVAQGGLSEVIREYDRAVRSVEFNESAGIGNETNRRGLGHARFDFISLGQEGKSNDFVEYGQDVEFTFSVQVMNRVNKLYASIMLRSSISGVPVCSTAKQLISDKPLEAGAKIKFQMTLKNTNLRPGEFPTYYWLGDEKFNPLDVVDDLTEPLVIVAKGNVMELGFDPTVHNGYFGLDVLYKRIN
jgi:ABC-type polysaccharide/polyol phosphate transport system ATPase subunit